MKKYEITDIAHPHNHNLRRIRALIAVRGCFLGSLDSFAAAVDKQHGRSKTANEYEMAIALCRLRLSDAQNKIDSGEVKLDSAKQFES